MAKDCGLLDKRLTLTSLDLIFTKSCDRGAKKRVASALRRGSGSSFFF